MRSAQRERIALLDSYKNAGRKDYHEIGFMLCKAALNTPEYSAYERGFNEEKENEIKKETT